MADDDANLEDLADSVLEGKVVDWAAAESTASEGERDTLLQLRVLSALVASAGRLRDKPRSLEPVGGVEPDQLARAAMAGQAHVSWGHLTLLEEVGRGKFGQVFRARDTRLDREVALKLLPAEPDGPPSEDPVIEEGRLLARVRHPNVVAVYGAERIDGRTGIWTEYIHGKTLAALVAQQGPLEPREAVAIGVDLCRALSALHLAGLLHRDVKAQNVLLEDGGRIVLTDFGTACERYQPAAAGGTPLYLAPELFDGAPATVKTDLYSLAVLLFHLLTGRFPVEGGTTAQVREAHAAGRRSSLRSLRPAIPEAIASVIEKAAAPQSDDRYSTASAMEQALNDAIGRTAGVASPSLHGRRWLPASRLGRWTMVVGVPVPVLAIAVWLVALRAQPSAGAQLGFKAQDMVLIAAFDNRTGDPGVAESIGYALQSDLGESGFLGIVARERINDALETMRKPSSTLVDDAIGRQICQRDRGIRVLVTGEVERRGPGFRIAARLVEPATGRAVWSGAADSPDQARTIRTVHLLAARLRAALGEEPNRIRRTDQQNEKVTTPSPRALEHYAAGMRLLAIDGPLDEQWEAAGRLFEQATKEDPEFASAYIYLSWTRDGAEALRFSARALELSPHVTERERLFIQASYHQQRGDTSKALAAYEALVTLHPDHYWGVNNLAGTLASRGPAGRLQALPYFLRLVDMRPLSFMQVALAAFKLFLAGRYDDAAKYAARARPLESDVTYADNANYVAWVELFPVWQRWRLADGDGALALLRQAHSRAQLDPTRELWREVGTWHLAFGQVREAAECYRHLPRPELPLAQVALLGGDAATARQLLRLDFARPSGPEKDPAVELLRITLLARTGLATEAKRVLAAASIGPIVKSIAGAEIAVAEGRLKEAAATLDEIRRSKATKQWYAVRELSARLLLRQHDVPRALAVLDEAVAGAFGYEAAGERADLWNEIQAARVSLLRMVGRDAEALAVETDLRKLLSGADSDYPVLKRLANVPPALASRPR